MNGQNLSSHEMISSKTILIFPNNFLNFRLDIIEKQGIIIFTKPSARTGYDTRSIFKRSLTGLNPEFSLS